MNFENFSESETIVLEILNDPNNDLGVMTYDTVNQHLRYNLSYYGFHSMLKDLNSKLRQDAKIDYVITTDQAGGGGGSLGIAKVLKSEIHNDLSQQVRMRLVSQSLREISAINDNTIFYGSDILKVAPVVTISNEFPNRFGAVLSIRGEIYPIVLSSSQQVETLVTLVLNEGYIDDKLQNYAYKLPLQILQINEAARLSGITEDERLISEVEPIGYCLKGFEQRRTEIILRELLQRYALRSQTITTDYLFQQEDSAVGGTFDTNGFPLKYAIINSAGLESVAFSKQYPLVLVLERGNPVSHTPFRICIELQQATGDLIRRKFIDSYQVSNPTDSERKGFARLLDRIKRYGFTFEDDSGIASRSKLVLPFPSN